MVSLSPLWSGRRTSHSYYAHNSLESEVKAKSGLSAKFMADRVTTQDLVYHVCFCYHEVVARTVLYTRMSTLLTILHNRSSSLPCVLKVLVRHATFFSAWSPHASAATWIDVSLIPQFRILRTLTLM